MLVRDYMTPYPKVLRSSDTLKDAAKLFYKYKINGAPVVTDAGDICGLITSSDFAKAIMNDVSFQQPVKTIMNTNVITIGLDATLAEAYQIPVSRLPVVSADNKLVGMLTKSDFLSAFRAEADHATDEIQAFIRSAHNGIIVINAYGIITTFNEAAAKLVGVPAEKAIGMPIAEIIPESGLREILLTGKSETGCQVTVGGKTVFSNRSPICEGPKIVGALAIIQDTSELSSIAEQLVKTQHHVEALENIFESARQGIIVIDEQGIIVQVNRSYEEIFNIDREDMIGRPIEETIENTRLHIVARTGIPELGQLQNVKGRQMVVNRVPIFKDGKIVGAIGESVFKDISEVSYLLSRVNLLEKQVSHYEQELGKTAVQKNKAEFTFASIIGSSRAIVQAKNLAAKTAGNISNVLITGESGTGKELFAHAIHNASPRNKMPFVAVNCAAIPAELLESELFGYDEGAFTGAKRGGKKGKFELADQGTLFLDEIGDMPLTMQAKILRALQSKSLDHLGGSKPFSCDVRIIAATNKNLLKMVKENSFREDLYYRLNVIGLEIPPLRERKGDIGELVLHLLPNICRNLGTPLKEFSPEVMGVLREHHWPGNVRELVNLLEQIAAMVDNQLITPQHLARMNFSAKLGGGQPSDQATYPQEMSEQDRIIETLKFAKNNRALAAKLLGWHRSTLYEKLKKYKL
ncbi:MAG: sigma 54-interacting transcriptional regulator [Negativicutes bacterium]|nr:sigma 54-interacting transcriptional regulator [Negativicutes bacterium]